MPPRIGFWQTLSKDSAGGPKPPALPPCEGRTYLDTALSAFTWPWP